MTMPATMFRSTHATLLRRNRTVVAARLVIFALLVAIAFGAPHAVPVAVVAPLFLACMVALVVSGLVTTSPRTSVGELEAGPEGVSFNGALLAPASSIRAGFVVPRPSESPLVRIERRFLPAIEICVQDEAEGRALLRALGLDASQTVARFPLAKPVEPAGRGARMLGVTVAGLIMVLFEALSRAGHHTSSITDLYVAVLGGVAVVALLAILPRPTLTVGTDGLYTSSLGKKRFIPYRKIKSIAPYHAEHGPAHSHGVSIILKRGKAVRLPVHGEETIDDEQTAGAEARLNTVLTRIREAMDSYEHGAAEGSAAALGRGGRDVGDWIRGLRAIGAGANLSHRTAPVHEDTLFRIVEDPSAGPDARAGAAVALQGSLDDAGRARLRAAAHATVEPRVRIALEAALSGDDEALAEALAEVEAARSDRRAAD